MEVFNALLSVTYKEEKRPGVVLCICQVSDTGLKEAAHISGA